VAGKLSSEAAAACKPWRCSTPCGSHHQQSQQQQQRVSASLHGDMHQQHQQSLTASLYSLGSSQAPPMSDYAAAAAGATGLLDSKPTIIAASMF